jgi:hypothetical protein
MGTMECTFTPSTAVVSGKICSFYGTEHNVQFLNQRCSFPSALKVTQKGRMGLILPPWEHLQEKVQAESELAAIKQQCCESVGTAYCELMKVS